MKTRRGFFKSLAASAALALACPKPLLDLINPNPKSIPNPAWEVAEYEISWIATNQYAFLPSPIMPILHLVDSGYGKGGMIEHP